VKSAANKSSSRLIRKIAGATQQETTVGCDFILVIQIIGDYPPKHLESFLKEATERQALAQQLGLTEKVVLVFSKIQSTKLSQYESGKTRPS